MFHAAGWTYPWAITAAFATQVCPPIPNIVVDVPQQAPQITLRTVNISQIWYHFLNSGVSHYCAAPTVQVRYDSPEI